jgi:hypothetical protein
MSNRDNFDFLIEMHESVAWETIQEYGFIPRVIRRNNIPIVCTRDNVPNRINLRISSNIVESYDLG